MLTEPSRSVSSVDQLYEGREEKAPVVSMMVTAPLQLVHLNFTSFKTTTDLNESPKAKYILVIVDHFMRYTRAYVTKDQKALTATKMTATKGSSPFLEHLREYSLTRERSSPVRW